MKDTPIQHPSLPIRFGTHLWKRIKSAMRANGYPTATLLILTSVEFFLNHLESNNHSTPPPLTNPEEGNCDKKYPVTQQDLNREIEVLKDLIFKVLRFENIEVFFGTTTQLFTYLTAPRKNFPTFKPPSARWCSYRLRSLSDLYPNNFKLISSHYGMPLVWKITLHPDITHQEQSHP